MGKILVIDTRSQWDFHCCHFENSINMPIDKCDDNFFIEWDPNNILQKYIKNPSKKPLFEQRKRLMVYIIGS